MYYLYSRMVYLTYICNAFAKVQNKIEISGTKVVRFHPPCAYYFISEYCIGFGILCSKSQYYAQRANILRQKLYILSEVIFVDIFNQAIFSRLTNRNQFSHLLLNAKKGKKSTCEDLAVEPWLCFKHFFD